ncbi:hypothetical protein PDESU_01013 [Pontiella desulfatans]|uniref:Outer membrane protein beta-barrel domain-containing protein n=1 Tax=Pontiella desulfatans TaxID=2750659 RepID=A0A6C2TXS4_PONDE|nr:hypothetical protein [Pontiella desulfatans]VGO12460.1 hypothetical protein PDESU_01013 [Pontiella desulfatans]
MKCNTSKFIMAAVAALMLPATGGLAEEAQKNDGWEFGASIYGWFPDMSGQLAFTPPGGSDSFTVNVEDVLDNIEAVLMVSFEARKGRWGVLTDFVYMDIEGSKSGTKDFTVGNQQLPANASADVGLVLENLFWTLAGTYQAVEKDWLTMNVIAGTRYFDVDQTLDWKLNGTVNSVTVADRSGSQTVEVENWDAIIGTRGRLMFGPGKSIFVPYELDVGAGDSDFTWQGAVGLGYSFGWAEIVAAWRYMYYDVADMGIETMEYSGPVLGGSFRW